MKNLNWQQGIKRGYYVLWALWCLFLVVGLIHDWPSINYGRLLLGGPFFFFIIPYAIMKAGQWVYEGLLTKQEQ